jgi:5-methylcytosine-specific restriction endonuclease McrA
MAAGGEKRSPTSHRTPSQDRAKGRSGGYNETPKEIAKREERNLNRQHAIKDGRVAKPDGKELDHKFPLSRGGSNASSNVRVTTQHANRVKGSKLPKH